MRQMPPRRRVLLKNRGLTYHPIMLNLCGYIVKEIMINLFMKKDKM
jgi:hypothetical protein